MESVKPPDAVNWTGNIDHEWRMFKQRFTLYLQAVGLDEASDARKIALLLTVAGPQSIEVFNTLVFAQAEDKGKYDVVMEKFDVHCTPRKNETFERYVFRSRLQQQGETFDSFLVDLKLKAKTCNFGLLQDSMVRDQIVFGINDKKVRERLLRETELTLNEAVRICQASEIAIQHAKTFSEHTKMSGSDNSAVAAVTEKQKSGMSKLKQQKELFNCKRCGKRHLPKQCPAYGKVCAKCKGQNHFAKQCFSKGGQSQRERVHAVEETSLSDTFFVGMVQKADISQERTEQADVNSVARDKWMTALEINGVTVSLKLDTGAKVNLISEYDVRAMKIKPRISQKTVQLKAYNGQNIPTKGTCTLRVKVKNREHYLMFVVVPDGHDSVLGDKACEDLGLVRRVYTINNGETQNSVEQIVKQFPDIFEGFGVLPFTYKIQLKKDAQPVVHAPRRVPAPLREKLRQELDKMTTMGVIEKVEEPTEWVNSMVCVKKANGDLRICMDPKDLNANIQREHYQIPTREEIISEMAGAKFFTKLDASQGFWQLKLHEDSTRYCTFNTPFGRYSFLRMPFGISSAPEVFHRAMEHVIEGIEGVRVYVDDIVLWGSTIEQHNKRLMDVLHRVRKYGLKLNRNKCQFGAKEITFLGDTLSERGVEPDKSKIQAILKMPRPTDRKAVLRVMGMINFVGKFIPNLSSKTVYLRELLCDKGEFRWTAGHEQEWGRLKTLLTTEPVLTFFDPTKKTKISTDASKDGMGAVLLQADGENWRPVAYASRTMTPTERRYAQIEKECLGLVYGLEKFHGYVYGLPTFVAETDHKPLIAIIKKNLNQMSPRIQRLMMRLQRYDMELMYTQGKHLVLADALSRAVEQSGNCESSTEADVTQHVNMVAEALPVTDTKLKQIAVETGKDKCLQLVIKHLNEGWPRGKCAQYYNIRTELSVVKGFLLRQDRIIIPQSLRQEMLKKLHEGHLGAEKCKRRARTAIYWPGINADIDKMVSTCDTCLKHHAKQQKEPMIITDPPDGPWQKVGTDLFFLDGRNYLLVIDYLSNYPEIALLSNTSSACVITHMKSIFARHGIPQVVCSDNGPCYSGRDFQKFAEEYGFQHVTSSPLYPQSNGKAEKGVHIVKLLLKKAVDSQSDPYLALLNYRASPLEHGVSPAEILMGRRLQTTLPCLATQNKRKYLKRKQKHLKLRQKANYDKASKSLEPLSNNDTVRLEDSNTWTKKATVLEEVKPRSYTVRTEDGQILRRNRRSLLKTKETAENTHTGDTDCAESTSETLPVLHHNEQAKEMHSPVLRRSNRTVKPPDRLNL